MPTLETFCEVYISPALSHQQGLQYPNRLAVDLNDSSVEGYPTLGTLYGLPPSGVVCLIHPKSHYCIVYICLLPKMESLLEFLNQECP